MTWLRDDASFGLFTFQQLTRAISWLIEQPFRLAESLLSAGFVVGVGQDAVELWPPIPWFALIAALVVVAHSAGGRGLALLVALCFLYLAVFGQWESAMMTLSSIVIAVPLGIALGALARHRGVPATALRACDHAAARSDADRARVRLPRADPVVLRLQSRRRDGRDHHLRGAADGPEHRAGAATRACRGGRLRAHGRLHARSDALEGADPLGAAGPHGRRQPGDHAVAQHGDHRLDDRGRRPRPRRAGGAAPARLRRRAGGGARHHPARDRARPAVAGVRAQAAARPWQGRAELRPPPSAPGDRARPAAWRLGARRASGPLRAPIPPPSR